MANPVTLWVFPIMTVYSPRCNVHRETDDKWLDLRLSQKRHTQTHTTIIQLSPPKIWFFNSRWQPQRPAAFPPHCSAWPRNKADQPRWPAGLPTKVQRSAGFGAGERMHLRPLGDRGCCMESPCPRRFVESEDPVVFSKKPGKNGKTQRFEMGPRFHDAARAERCWSAQFWPSQRIKTLLPPAPPVFIFTIACCRCSSPITGNQLTPIHIPASIHTHIIISIIILICTPKIWGT